MRLCHYRIKEGLIENIFLECAAVDLVKHEIWDLLESSTLQIVVFPEQ